MLYLNVAGLPSNHIMLKQIVHTNQSWFMVFLTETHIVEQDAFDQYGLTGITVISCLSNSRHTGGVTILIRECAVFKILINEARDKNWFLAISTKIHRKHTLFGLVYHSPSASYANFIKLLETRLEQYLDPGQTNSLIRDFNINWMNAIECKPLRHLMESLNMNQMLREKTRITYRSKTLINHVYCNNDSVIASVATLAATI